MIWLDMPQPKLTEVECARDELATALRIPPDSIEALPIVKTQDGDLLVFVRDFFMLNEAKPDFGRLLELQTREHVRALSLATVNTVTPSINLQSRCFAPAAGVNEDPVTGSVHGPLGAYLVTYDLVPVHDGLAGFTCAQGKPGGRAGIIHALVQREPGGTCAVRIGGQAVATMHGTLIE
jgi:trans-2,3-dihydro-3-hydroxyanthranilate isomerase